MTELHTSQNSERNSQDQAPAEEFAIRDLREQRLCEYMHKALANANPLLANLGVANADLMRLAGPLAEIIQTSIISSENPLRTFGKLGTAMDSYLKLNRQIDRFAQLELRHDAASAQKSVSDSPEA